MSYLQNSSAFFHTFDKYLLEYKAPSPRNQWFSSGMKCEVAVEFSQFKRRPYKDGFILYTGTLCMNLFLFIYMYHPSMVLWNLLMRSSGHILLSLLPISG
jgi:hypothetical protein